MLKSTDPKRLGTKEGSWWDSKISWGRGIQKKSQEWTEGGKGWEYEREQVESGYGGGSTERDYCKGGTFRCQMKTWCIESP